MNRLSIIATIFVFFFSLSGCTHKRMLNKGAELEQQGLYRDAFDNYYQTLKTKDNLIEAKLGLQRTGRHCIDNILGDFSAAFEVSHYREAVYHYQEAIALQEKAKEFGMDVKIPAYYHEYYQECKIAYLDQRYREAIKLLDKNQYEMAEQALREISAIDSEYRDVDSRLETAIYEPKYLMAEQLMDEGKYRTAYGMLSRIIDETGGYKDSRELREQAREEAIIHIGIDDFKSSEKNGKLAAQVQEEIAHAISKSDNPFIKLIEYDDNGRVPDAIVKAEVISTRYYPGSLSKDNKPGWFRKSARKDDVIRSGDYKKIKYDEYSQNRKLYISLSLKMVNTKNNELMVSEQYDLSASDYIHYAKYSGDDSRLVPGYWKYLLLPNREDIIKDYPDDVRKLRSLLDARKTIKSSQQLANELSNELALKTLSAIENYNPEAK
ncbi:MAG: hypothetical protein ACOCXO_02695 [Bacteroidota bacterium]